MKNFTYYGPQEINPMCIKSQRLVQPIVLVSVQQLVGGFTLNFLITKGSLPTKARAHNGEAVVPVEDQAINAVITLTQTRSSCDSRPEAGKPRNAINEKMKRETVNLRSGVVNGSTFGLGILILSSPKHDLPTQC
jgi:hypothetical protein